MGKFEPKFDLKRTEKLYISEDLITNGHWAIIRSAIEIAPKVIAKLTKNLPPGVYPHGVENERSGDCPKSIEHIIPRFDGYERMSETPVGVEFGKGAARDRIVAYIFKSLESGFLIGVQPQYVPILRMGAIFAKDPKSPFVVRVGDETTVAIVMPVRLS